MDGLTDYGALVKAVLGGHAELGNRTSRSGAQNHFVVADDEHGLYVLVRAGWADGRRIRGTAAFVRIQGGKIWIEEDGTEEGIAYELVAAGVPKEDIVLGFQPTWARPLGEFAVA